MSKVKQIHSTEPDLFPRPNRAQRTMRMSWLKEYKEATN